MTSNAFLERFKNRHSTVSKLGEIDVSTSKPISTATIRLTSANPAPRIPSSPKNSVTRLPSTPSPNWTREMDANYAEMGNRLTVSRNEQIRSRESSVDRMRSRGKDLGQFQPYTLKEYTAIRDQPLNLGGLGPNTLGSEDWLKRKELQDRKQEYARLIQGKNKSIPKAIPKPKPGLPKSSARDRALEFSKRVPKPQVRSSPQEVEAIIEQPPSTRLEELEAQHDACQKAVEGIRAQMHV